jgi:hypothetical protein
LFEKLLGCSGWDAAERFLFFSCHRACGVGYSRQILHAVQALIQVVFDFP